ncbi:MAG: hypothetical protein R2762_06345 [Bryobacteraceae bacterium]
MSVSAESVQVLATGAGTLRTVQSAVRRFMASQHFLDADSASAQRTVSLHRLGKWVSVYDSGLGDATDLAAAVSRATGGPALSLSATGPDAVAARLYEDGKLRAGQPGAWADRLSRSEAAELQRALRAPSGSASVSILRLAQAVGIAPESALPHHGQILRADRQLHFRLPDWAALRTASGPPLLTDGGYPGYTVRLRAGERWSFDTGTYVGNEGGPLRGLEVRLHSPAILKKVLTVDSVHIARAAAPSSITPLVSGPLRRVFQLESFELGAGWGLPPEGRVEDWYSVFNRELRRQSFAQQHAGRIVTAALAGRALSHGEGVLELILTPLQSPAGSVAIPIHFAVGS